MSISSSRSEVFVQVDTRKYLTHRYSFDTTVPELRLDRGLVEGALDVDADRQACEPQALDYEDDCLIEQQGASGLWHPTDNPNPVWDKNYRANAVGRYLLNDAIHIENRFNGVTDFGGQLKQLDLIFKDPAFGGFDDETMAGFLGITLTEWQSIVTYHANIEDATRRQLYTDLQNQAMTIAAIEFTKG